MKTRAGADKTIMMKATLRCFALLTLSVLSQAQESRPGMAVIKTGWEEIKHNVYVYYGPETQRSLDNVYLTEPLGTVRKMGSFWMFQTGRKSAMTPAMSKKDAQYAVERFTSPEGVQVKPW